MKLKIVVPMLGLLLFLLAPNRAAAQNPNAATFLRSDTSTQGNWHGAYGADGYSVAEDSQNIPGYAVFAVQNQQDYTWDSSTADPRALQTGSGLGRIAATWYNSSTFSFDVNLADGNPHQVAVYAIDWDSQGRSETIQVLDATTQAVLDTRSLSSFTGGVYLVWTITGHVTISISQNGGPNAVVSGVFFGGSSTITSAATFLRSDTTTQGNWHGAYGADGYSLANDRQSIPAYASLAPQNQSNWTWASSTTDPRALQTVSGLGRMAATWYAASDFDFDVNLTDGNTHQVSLYVVDWDIQGRSEVIQVLDGATEAVLDTETVSVFTNGEYLVWNISGHVKINVIQSAGPNAVVSGVFFGGSSSVSSTASFIRSDTTTQGNWHAAYGADGYSVANDSQSLPSYASFAPQNQLNWTWDANPSQISALQTGSGSGRIAATWYNSPAFSFDVNFTDGNSHQISLYALDFDGQGRSEVIQVLDAATEALLDTRTVSSFTGGTYLVWNVSGHVTISVVQVSGPNAVVSGVFFGGSSTINSRASFVRSDATTQGNWQGTYGADGYSLANASQSFPSYASVAIQNESNWTWNPNPADVRALETGSGSARIAATWYNNPSFSFDVNLTDGNTHQVSLYAVDWDSQGRSEIIQVLDAATEAVLDTETLSTFTGGDYLAWNVSGHVRINAIDMTGPNAVVSGIFFDPVTTGGSGSNSPAITGISPTSGPAGTQVTISGTNFGSSQGASTVTFNGTTATAVSWSLTTIVATVPPGATSGSVVVTVGGVSATGPNFTVLPTVGIQNVSPVSGPVGTLVAIAGTAFGSTQGASSVTFNGTPASVLSWSATSIIAAVPSGATTGNVVVSASGQTSNGVNFTVTSSSLPGQWLDTDVGSVSLPGSATFLNGTFTLNGVGDIDLTTSDQMHLAYLPLSGDGTIIARVVTLSGNSAPQAGVMIRETLNANAANAFAGAYGVTQESNIELWDRPSTGANPSSQLAQGSYFWALPQWVMLVRSGNTFTGYRSIDGINWSPNGTTQTIPMAQNVYIGLAMSCVDCSSLGTATFDNVSISTPSNPAPVITTLSATTGPTGTQVVISGSGFGTSQANSVVTLNAEPIPVSYWSNTAITATIPSNGSTGPLLVSVAPNMNDSNYIIFTVTSYPLPTTWLDQDVGPTPAPPGSASFSSGIFTLNFAPNATGTIDSGSTDEMHFAYVPLSGDGTIIARVLSTSAFDAGLMIRETLGADAANAFLGVRGGGGYYYMEFLDRPSAGEPPFSQLVLNGGYYWTLPQWLKLVRSGITFTGYESADGVNWTQIGPSLAIEMAQNVYIGLAVDGYSTSPPYSTTFDGVSVSTPSSPAPFIEDVSPTTGPAGTEVVVSGSGFGASQGSSLVMLSDVPATPSSWSDTSITLSIPSGATSGPLLVSVAPTMNASNPVTFTVTGQPLPSSWLDQDIGAVSLLGSASFANGVFTLNGVGSIDYGATDQMHFAYLPLSGDGTIIARVVTAQGNNTPQAGVMVRETLNTNSSNAFVGAYGLTQGSTMEFWDRPSTGGNPNYQLVTAHGSLFDWTLPQWVKLVRSGNTFTGYRSADGVSWSQIGTSQTIPMAQNVYVGLAMSCIGCTSLGTATFDNVTVSFNAPASGPIITNLSPSADGIGRAVTISGTNFGATQSTSTVSFNGTPASVLSWSNWQIVASVPAGATSGPVTIQVNAVPSNSDFIFTVVNPTIEDITPPAGPTVGLVTLTGFGFGASQGTSEVQFNGVVSPVVSWSDTSIQAYVPSGAVSGPVTVTVSDVTSNPVPFTVTGTLSVTSVSPAIGPVGTAVAITGTGFGQTQSTSTVNFYGAGPSTITSWSDTAITAIVPSGASTGPVSVTVANIAAEGPLFELSATVQLSDSLGNQTSYTSIIAGGKWYVSNAQGPGCSSCTLRGNITRQFDGLGNILSTTDSLGLTTSYTYDSNNDVTQMTQPTVSAGTSQTTYTYNSFGEVLTTTDPLGNVTRNTYDSHGNLLTVATPAPNGNTAASVTQFAYNALGELTQITDPLGHVTNIAYNSVGLIASISDAQNNVTSYGYDSRGNRTSVTDALGHTTTFTYDMGNRLTQITYPDSTTASFTYDYRGRRITATDQNGKTTTYAYDDADRLTSVTDAANNVTTYAYDTENNPLGITDANNHVTNFTYDAFGRVTQTAFPSTLVETYSYDADNNLIGKTDRKNQTINYVYDALNRLTQKTYPDSTSVEYTYDLVGKVLQVNDPTGTYSFSYDNMGRLTGTSTQYSFLTGTFTNAYSYDAASNRTGYTAPDGSTNTYTYDNVNRLTTLANSWAGSFGFSYDALSRRTQMTRPNNVTTSYTYDNLSRLLSVLHQLSGSTIDGATYAVDNAGNRTAKTDNRTSVTSNYAYDAIYELTQVTQGATTTESYSYDPVGNRLSSLGVSPYQYNPSNEMVSTPTALHVYDNNGNLTSKTDSTGMTSYAWDFENRLTSVSLPGSDGTVTFKYDPFGRRVQKVFALNSTTTNYLYDLADSVEERDQSGNLLARYSRTTNIDEPLAESRSGTTTYLEQDGIGSITSLSNGAGTLTQTYTFDSFGKLTASSSSLANPFQYTGREFDTETNLYYYRARYFDPSAGRFVSQDPVGFAAGNNFYEYVGNEPVFAVDPSGLSTLVFDRYLNTLYAFDKNNIFKFSCPAANRTDHRSKGPWPVGQFPYDHHNYHPPNPNGSFGSYGIFIFDVPGRSNMGVHSGQANSGGPSHPTFGCVRTDDPCMEKITDLNATDPLTILVVE